MWLTFFNHSEKCFFGAGEAFWKMGDQNLARFTWASNDFTQKGCLKRLSPPSECSSLGDIVGRSSCNQIDIHTLERVYRWPTFKQKIIHMFAFFFPLASTPSFSPTFSHFVQCFNALLEPRLPYIKGWQCDLWKCIFGAKTVGSKAVWRFKNRLCWNPGCCNSGCVYVSLDGHCEVLWYFCLRKSNSDVFFEMFFKENWGAFSKGSAECRGSCRSQLDYQKPLSKCILHAYNGFVPRFWPLIRPTNSCIVIYMRRQPREKRFSWTGGQIWGTWVFPPFQPHMQPNKPNRPIKWQV